MTCVSCAARLEKRHNGPEGVEASVNYATEIATVTFDADRVAPQGLVEAVAETGHAARPPAVPGRRRGGRRRGGRRERPLRRRLIASAVLSLPSSPCR